MGLMVKQHVNRRPSLRRRVATEKRKSLRRVLDARSAQTVPTRATGMGAFASSREPTRAARATAAMIACEAATMSPFT